MVIELAAGICFLAAAACAALWWRARAGLRGAIGVRDAAVQDRAAMTAMLGTLPVAAFHWPLVVTATRLLPPFP